MRVCPRGGACGCLRAPAVSFGVFDYTTDSKGCQVGFAPVDILRVLVVYWIVYQCFFELSTGYPQGCPQGTIGLIWVNMGFDLDQLFAFGWHYLCFGTPLVLHRAPLGHLKGSLYKERARTQLGDTMFTVFFA